MRDYQKVSSITFSAQVTADSSTVITRFNKNNLISWLTNNVSSNDVAVFFRRESNSGNDIQLVISDVNSSGAPGTAELASAKLPCPEYCPH